MGLPWLLITSCVLCCVIKSLSAESEVSAESEDGTSLLLGSLFGFRPCLDETCGGSRVRSADVILSDQEDYEPQYPDVASPTPGFGQYCLQLHSSTIHNIAFVGKRHPEFEYVQLKVIEDLLRYVSQFSVLDGENCDPAMKLLDFILLAAETLKVDYVNECGKTCNYTIVEDKSGAYIESDKPKADISLTTPQSTVEPLSTSPVYVSTEASTKIPCPQGTEESNKTDVEAKEKPCPAKPSESIEPVEDLIPQADESHYPSPPFVGSVRAIPGVHYPNYTDVPLTSFSCADKKFIPGFYADLETGCQVFHVCYEHRRESFLCPVGTIFNQPILACDYWYSSNCSIAPAYYDVNAKADEATEEGAVDAAVEELITILVDDKKKGTGHKDQSSLPEVDIKKFLPVKAKVVEFTKPVIKDQETTSTAKPEFQEVEEIASQIFNKMVSTATDVVSKTRHTISNIPDPSESKLKTKPISFGETKKPEIVYKVKPIPVKASIAKVAAVKTGKAKFAVKSAVPIIAKSKLSAVKVSVPISKAVAKAVPVVAKTKLAVPKAVVKMSIPLLKTKTAASALPLAKSKMVVPVLKGKVVKTAGLPLTLPVAKGKLASVVPKAKVKILKGAAISPITKKALALGYMKLLKAKKLALMG